MRHDVLEHHCEWSIAIPQARHRHQHEMLKHANKKIPDYLESKGEDYLLFQARNTLLTVPDIFIENDYVHLIHYYINTRQEYIKASQALYAYSYVMQVSFLSALQAEQGNEPGAKSREFVLSIWAECTRISLLAMSCLKLVKPNAQSFPFPDHIIPTPILVAAMRGNGGSLSREGLPSQGGGGAPGLPWKVPTKHGVILHIEDVELMYLQCKSVLNLVSRIPENCYGHLLSSLFKSSSLDSGGEAGGREQQHLMKCDAANPEDGLRLLRILSGFEHLKDIHAAISLRMHA